MGEEKCCLLAGQATDSVNPLIPLAFKSDAGTTGSLGHYHEADIVARFGVALAWITQADDQLQRSNNRLFFSLFDLSLRNRLLGLMSGDGDDREVGLVRRRLDPGRQLDVVDMDNVANAQFRHSYNFV